MRICLIYVTTFKMEVIALELKLRNQVTDIKVKKSKKMLNDVSYFITVFSIMKVFGDFVVHCNKCKSV